ncbi:exodeoxyribonuclease 7 small subunit [Candidatus Moduliflexus flocculans]|uniref:Exodeoxyribonuclease 7 small subunit n=1 Tax=Candidatus Moduliflexus flocculans TaxID=1499966 RepID=A0A0S6VQR8_9BACT|nr:exodeoxyribonuclease 7 small subunit [Candidatus Moduliflexus flocculans]
MTEMTFEDALTQLEKAVEQLESGELPLERALEVFETGVKMSRFCSAKLNEVEQKVELLLNVKDGEPETAAFDMDTLQDED